uniref:AIG1-type G domain-containing protein n=1 Tax=Cyprinus carpio TaxID=7962 RepID=A0A8C1QVC0_CYPCA
MQDNGPLGRSCPSLIQPLISSGLGQDLSALYLLAYLHPLSYSACIYAGPGSSCNTKDYLRIQRKTGAGKSSSGNIILGQKVFEAHLASESVTEECQQYQQKVESRKISVIDTSGPSDSSISEEQLKEEILKCVEMSVLGPHGFLDEKITDEEETVKWIQENFGEEAARYTINMFTRGDQLNTPIE